jgi:hypothetical protein
MAQTRNVHLVGSVPLDDADAVFTALGRRLGTRCRRYPDGETGERSNWTQWQAHVFKDHPALTSVMMGGPTDTRARFALRDDANPDSRSRTNAHRCDEAADRLVSHAGSARS